MSKRTAKLDRELNPSKQTEAISIAFPVQPLLDLVEWHDPDDPALAPFEELMGGLLPEFARVRDEALGRESGVDLYVSLFQIAARILWKNLLTV